MIDARIPEEVEQAYQADLAAIDQHYAAACEAAGARRRAAIAEATRVRAERIESAHRNEGVFV